MNGWIDWREIEQQNDWGVREKTDAMGEMWDKDASTWDSRWKNEEDFTRRQAEALGVLSTDTVLDIGCGTGPLTMHVAPRVKRIIAQDYGADMLDLVRENARVRGLHNVDTLKGNWHDMEPGKDLPICDVAIARWSPAQGNILKMSRCATRYCYSLSSCARSFDKGGASTGGFWCRSTTDRTLNTSPRPCARKYGFNVHFNLLYDHGANPTVSYVQNEHKAHADTRDELIEAIMARFRHPGRKTKGVQEVPPFVERGIMQDEDGRWSFSDVSTIAILGWDPNDVTC